MLQIRLEEDVWLQQLRLEKRIGLVLEIHLEIALESELICGDSFGQVQPEAVMSVVR